MSCCSQGLLEGLKGEQEEAWLVHFVDTEDFHDVELRKLPAMLGGIKVGVRHVTPPPPPPPLSRCAAARMVGRVSCACIHVCTGKWMYVAFGLNV